MIQNNQYNNQPYYGNMPYNQGAMYGQQQQVKRSNPLTAEEIATLRNKTPFNLSITQEEITRGRCFHVDENGVPTTITEPDGTTTCTLCGAKWNSNELSGEQVEEATQNILSILQTIKLMYLNFPDQAAREYYQIIPLLQKVPQLYKIAADNFRAYEGFQNGYYNGQPNPFMLFGQIAGGNGFANAFQYQQTQPMGYGAPNPAMAQPMYGNPGYGAQPAPQAMPMGQPNPFTMPTTASSGYVPNTPQGYNYVPGQTPVAPEAPVAQPAQTAAPAEVSTSGNHTP